MRTEAHAHERHVARVRRLNLGRAVDDVTTDGQRLDERARRREGALDLQRQSLRNVFERLQLLHQLRHARQVGIVELLGGRGGRGGEGEEEGGEVRRQRDGEGGEEIGKSGR